MDKALLSLRQLSRSLNLTRAITVCRQLIHFGPWRHGFILLIRVFRRPSYPNQAPEHERGLFDHADYNAILSKLGSDGVSLVGTLPPEFVSAIRHRTDRLPLDHFQNIHETDPDIRRLVTDTSLINLVRLHLDAEPVMLECTLTVTGSGSDVAGLQTRFHFDYAGWHSINVFVYLTDVTEQSACHTVITGTHKRKSISDILRQFLSDEEAMQRYGNKITPIMGKAGTVFIENTEAFHKRQSSPERRVMLNVLFASHNNWLGKGRTMPANTQRRDKLYRQFSG